MRRARRTGASWAEVLGAIGAGLLTAALVLGLTQVLETRDSARDLCVQVVRSEYPGYSVDVSSMSWVRRSQYLASGTVTLGSSSPVPFDCIT